jgi:hypothetical protein
MRRHAELLVVHYENEGRGCRDFRKHVAWYLKGYVVGGELRSALAQVENLLHFDELVAELDLDQPYPGVGAEGARGRQGTPKRVCLPDGWLDARGLSAEMAEMVSAAEVSASGG